MHSKAEMQEFLSNVNFVPMDLFENCPWRIYVFENYSDTSSYVFF